MMERKRFAYILMGTDSSLTTSHTVEIDAKFADISICMVRDFHVAKEMVINLWQEGYGAIELCGAFGRDFALELINLTNNEVVIGYVVNEPEQNDIIMKFFGKL